jgi:hypothetical protein
MRVAIVAGPHIPVPPPAHGPRVDLIHSHGFDLLEIPTRPEPDHPARPDRLRPGSPISGTEAPPLRLRLTQPARRLHVYNGEDSALFPVVTAPSDFVCFLGRFDREKNSHLAIQLATNLGIPIKIAGITEAERRLTSSPASRPSSIAPVGPGRLRVDSPPSTTRRRWGSHARRRRCSGRREDKSRDTRRP